MDQFRCANSRTPRPRRAPFFRETWAFLARSRTVSHETALALVRLSLSHTQAQEGSDRVMQFDRELERAHTCARSALGNPWVVCRDMGGFDGALPMLVRAKLVGGSVNAKRADQEFRLMLCDDVSCSHRPGAPRERHTQSDRSPTRACAPNA